MRAVLGVVLGLLLLACGDYPEVVSGDPCPYLGPQERAIRGCVGSLAPGYGPGDGSDAADPPTAAEIAGRCATGRGRVSLEPGVRLRSAIVVTHGCALDPLLGGLSALIGGRTYRIAAIDGAVALVREEAEATIDLLVQREQQPPFLGALVSARQALEPLHEAWRAEYLGFSELTVGSLSAAGPCITARIDGLLHVSPSRMPPAAYSYLVPFDASPYACALTGTLLIAPLAAEPPVLADGAPSRAADAGSLPARRVDGGVSVCPGPGGEDGGTRRIPATDAGVPGCVCGEASLCRP